jgi:hypothetical protein
MSGRIYRSEQPVGKCVTLHPKVSFARKGKHFGVASNFLDKIILIKSLYINVALIELISISINKI